MSQSAIWKNDREDDDRVNFWGDMQNSRFNFLNYIPVKYQKKYVWYTAGSVLAVVLLIIIIVAASTKKTGLISNANSQSKLFFIINETNIMQYTLETDELLSHLEAPENAALSTFGIHSNKDSYWVDNFTGVPRIAARINGSEKVLLQEKRFKPSAFALDHAAENLYATDDTAGLLIALNVRSGYFTILLTDMIRPRDVVLDSDEGLVFVSQYLHSIIAVGMDGSESTAIINEINITSLTIDSNKKRLYWINNFLSIESSDYYGRNRRTIYTDTASTTGVTFIDGHLFWTVHKERENTTTIFACNVDSYRVCDYSSTRNIGIGGNATSLRGYTFENTTLANPCGARNGGCDQLCLASGSNQSSCACRMGWQLESNRVNCSVVRDFVLYVIDDTVRTCSLDGKREIFWPTRYQVNNLAAKTEIDFDYDLRNDFFYFTDDHHIHRMKLKSYAGQEVVLSVDSSSVIDDIGYNWLTGNLYYGQRHVNATLEHSLMIFSPRLGESYRKQMKLNGETSMKARSYAFVLHPAKGYVFVALTSDAESQSTQVYRASINGSESGTSYHLFAEGSQDHRFFTIDFATDRLYAVQETGQDIWIAYVDIKSPGMEFPSHPRFVDARTIAVHHQWLYLSNDLTVYRFDKVTPMEGLRIAPRIVDPAKKIVGVRVVSEEVQLAASDDPCAKDNGGCEQFCFTGSTAICDCKHGQRVDGGGHCH